MSSIDPSNSAPRARRRLAAWLAFGAVGLATGAVWASGFAQASGANDDVAPSPALTKTTPVADVNALASVVTSPADLDYDWQGRWGQISDDVTLFKVDLTGHTGTYNLALLVTNTSDLSGWASTQLQVERIDVAASGTCAAADYTKAGAHADVVNFDDQDGGVYWGPVPGNAVYCIGVASSHGDDADATFLRAAQDTPPTGFPTFITTVDRAS